MESLEHIFQIIIKTECLKNMNQIKNRYCDIILVYVKISLKYIELNENNIIVSFFFILIFLFIFLSFIVLQNNLIFPKKMTF